MRRFVVILLVFGATVNVSYALKGDKNQLSYKQRILEAERLIQSRENLREFVGRRGLQDVILQKHKSSKKTKKSESPSAAPTISAMPTVSMAPSSSPTISMMPSATPSRAPSATPTLSSAPSAKPSLQPSASPTVSSIPSGAPSQSPTTSHMPTGLPTVSASPTALTADTNTSTGPDGIVTHIAECTEPIPMTAFVEQQRVDFRYELTLQPGKDLDEAVNQVEERTNLRLANQLLGDCTYTSGRAFETQGVLSVPRDSPTGASCGQDCYVVDGSLTLILFYTNRRRLQLQTDLSQEEAAELGPVLVDLFDGEALVGNGVISTKFGGITNGPIETSSTNDKGTTGAAITEPTVNSADTKVVASSVVVAVAAVALVVVLFVATRRRKEAKARVERMMLSDEMSDDDLEVSKDYGARTRGSSYEGYLHDEDSLEAKARVLNDMSDYDADSAANISGFDVEGYSVNTSFVKPQFIPTAQIPRDLEARKYQYRERNYIANDTVVL